jgi:uncharacterized protein YegP (UPF0339 family)
MSDSKPSGTLSELYRTRIGTPRTDDEVRGYWLFALGVILTLLGVVVYAYSNAVDSAAVNYTYRQYGVVLSGIGAPLVMLGSIVRFPLRRTATTLASVGVALCVIAVAWFIAVYPGGWQPGVGRVDVMGLYALGVVLIGLAGAVVPLVTDPVDVAHAALQESAAETSAELDETETELEETSAELDETAAELEETQTRVRELEEENAATTAQLETLRTSRARFELYEDAGGKHRWRLRHRNGNVIADSGQGYASRQKSQQGMHSVMRNALGAGVLRIDPEEVAGDEPEPADADEPELAVPDEPAESRASFELYADSADEWRWRLRHDNGNVIADSGEGYASRSNAIRSMNRVRSHVAGADYLRIDPAAFELYRDSSGKYRWRLLHENGSILADSGQGYASRAKARQGVESVRSNVADAETEVIEE